jgi:hypothetical protein
MNSIVVNGVTYVPQMSENAPFVIARCKNAGVHAGYMTERKDGVVRLVGARRLWRWWSKATLSELASEGPLKSKEKEQRYGAPIRVDLTESDVCEVIYCSDEARTRILAIPEWKNA